LQAEIARLQGLGVGALFDFGSTQDEKNSSQVIGGADQGGLGLPDRDYYTKTDDKSKELRKQYEEHVAKMLGLVGDDSAKGFHRSERDPGGRNQAGGFFHDSRRAARSGKNLSQDEPLGPATR
jgi:predicted metalloendopeptidase